MYTDFESLLRLAQEKNKPLWQIVLENECRQTEKTEQEVWKMMDGRLKVMEQSAHNALLTPQQTFGGLIDGISATQNTYAESGKTIAGHLINRVMALAFSCSETNASMGKICAAPTAGACGVLPAVLIGVSEEKQIDREGVLRGLMTASGVGAIFVLNATVAGAEGGCQAECGVAAAMAAAAAVEMMGGTPEASVHAAVIVIMNVMGLVCDPVAGLVQVPCAVRNASQAVNALLSADLALGGHRSVILPDEVVAAMVRVGHHMPMELKETSLGGIAISPSARVIAKKVFGNK